MPDGVRSPTVPAGLVFDASRVEVTPIQVLPEGRDFVVICHGELDLAALPDLRDALTAVLGLDPDRVVVDLSEVSLFDCAAIGEFVRGHHAARLAGRQFVLRGPSALGRHTLSILSLAGLIESGDAPERAGSASTPTGRQVLELVIAWRRACEASGSASPALLFADPAVVVRAVARHLGALHLTSSPSALGDLVAASGRADGSSSKAATAQLMVLRRVLHAWVMSNGRSEGEREGMGDRVDDAIDAVVASLVDDLEQAALLDPLTGLLNRRALDRDLSQCLAVARRRGQSLTVVVLDVDGLKTTNDHLGHAAGDDALRRVAATLGAALRTGDNAYRVGGDEFVLLLPELDPIDVDGLMHRADISVPVTFTWGSASVTVGDDPTAASGRAGALLELADHRMLDERARARAGERSDPPRPQVADRPIRPWDATVKLAGQIRTVSRTEMVIEQAIGVVAQHLGLTIDAASTTLRDFARRRPEPIMDVAAMLVDRTLDITESPTRRAGSVPSVRTLEPADADDVPGPAAS